MTFDAAGTIGGSLHGSPKAHQHQWGVLALASVVSVAGLTLPFLSIEQQFWIVLVPIMIFGLSHGGADPLILKRLANGRSRALFIATGLYMTASSGFIALTWFFPVLALLVFLSLSVWHFGFTDMAFLSPKANPLLLWLSGSLPILGPVIGHPDQTGELFAWLISYDPDAVIAVLKPAGPLLAALWLAAFGFLVRRHHRQLGVRAPAELLLVGVSLVLLPPLLAFAFYFCVIHSVRHFLCIAEHGLGEAEKTATVTFLARKAAPATLGAIALGLAAWATIMLVNPASSLLVEAVKVMFWALAALTLPHVFVVKLWWNRDRTELV